MQGLYLPVKAVSLPVDFSAHWLMLNPFGKDGRYDTLDSSDRPQYKPQVRVRVRAGVRVRVRGLTPTLTLTLTLTPTLGDADEEP